MEENDPYQALIGSFPQVWWEHCGKIQTKTGDLISPTLNYLQRLMTEVWIWCQDVGRPFRVIILKPRQKGCSTYSTALLYHFLSSRMGNGYIIGGAHDQGSNLMKMVGRYADHDPYFKRLNPAEVLEKQARWKNGSRCLQGTAKNPEAGRSGTFQFVLATEVARWAEEGVANASEVLSGLLKCVPTRPDQARDTGIILESTARGASGDFYDRWQRAVEFEDAKETGADGYIRIFAPWFAFEDSRIGFDSEEQKQRFQDSMSSDDIAYAEKWQCDLEQMFWRRQVIRDECQNDPEIFEQDYPATAESAFLTSGRRRFSRIGLSYLREGAGSFTGDRFIWGHTKPDFGMLVHRPSRRDLEPLPSDPVAWQPEPDPTTAMVWMWDKPKPGSRYLVSVDQAKGESESASADPDNYGIQCWRAGEFDGGKWMPPKMVSRLASVGRNGPECRWDSDIVQDEVYKLSKYYGNCIIAIEDNFDRGLIEGLKRRGAYLYRREQFNRIQKTKSLVYGWNTNTHTRGVLVERLAKAIREYDTEGSGIEAWCPWLVDELFSFVQKTTGKVEASDGSHDDQVISAGIAITLIEHATRFFQRPVIRPGITGHGFDPGDFDDPPANHTWG